MSAVPLSSKDLDLLDTFQRFKYFIGLLTYKCVHGTAPNYLNDRLTFIRELHEHDTRNEHLLRIPPCHSNAMKRTFTHAAASLWNALSSSVHEAPTLNIFKKGLRHSLISD